MVSIGNPMQTVLYVPKSLHIPAETLVSPYLMKVQPFSEDGIIPSGASTLYILASGAVLKRNRSPVHPGVTLAGTVMTSPVLPA